MTTILPPTLGTAELMPGCPCTEDGTRMSTSTWYRVSRSETDVNYVAISLHGVYQCTPTGRVRDFFECLHARGAVESREDALRYLGFEVSA